MSFGKHLSDVRRLNIVTRYQNRFMHKRVSVSAHMACTGIVAQFLAILEEHLHGENVDVAELLQRAINFNLTQAITGNMLSSLNKLSPSMEGARKTMKIVSYNEYIKPDLPEKYKEDYERFIVYAKDNSIEGLLLSAADCIDTMLECIEEININNCSDFRDILLEAYDILKTIDLVSVKYMLKYVIPSFKVKDNVLVDEFKTYSESIVIEGLDDAICNDFSVIGGYISEYRKLLGLMRYQNRFMFEKVSDAEHMWSVAKISQILSLWMIDKFDTCVDIKEVLCRALNHDFSEYVTGDILSTTKRMTPMIKKAVDEMEEVAFYSIIEPLIPKLVLNDFKRYILYPKSGGVEGKIISAADIIDTIYECAREIKLGNTEFLPVLQRVTESLLSIDLKAVDYFLVYALQDIGLDVKDYFGIKTYEYIESVKNNFKK